MVWSLAVPDWQDAESRRGNGGMIVENPAIGVSAGTASPLIAGGIAPAGPIALDALWSSLIVEQAGFVEFEGADSYFVCEMRRVSSVLCDYVEIGSPRRQSDPLPTSCTAQEI
jgi:hypothetical protein